ncbi:hypothetical protein [Blastococcus sp. SYSU DS1024]
MPNRTSKRVAATTGFAVATVSLGMAFAPAALAADLPALQGSKTAVVGQPYSLSGTGCDAAASTVEAAVYVDVYTAAGAVDPNADPVLTLAGEPENGAWTAVLDFTDAAPAGEYVAFAFCEPYAGNEQYLDYPEFAFTLQAATVVTPPSTPAPGAIRGESANTPGVGPTTSTAAKSTAPGQKVVKVIKGFKPGEVVTLTMHSTPTTIGTFTADNDGVITAEFTLAAGTAEGTHTLVYEGNQGTYFQESLVVAAATTSTDSLAYTGASVGLPLALGAGLLVAGGGALVVSRRRAGASQA